MNNVPTYLYFHDKGRHTGLAVKFYCLGDPTVGGCNNCVQLHFTATTNATV